MFTIAAGTRRRAITAVAKIWSTAAGWQTKSFGAMEHGETRHVMEMGVQHVKNQQAAGNDAAKVAIAPQPEGRACSAERASSNLKGPRAMGPDQRKGPASGN